MRLVYEVGHRRIPNINHARTEMHIALIVQLRQARRA